MYVKPTIGRSKWPPLLLGNGYMGISLHSRNHTGKALSSIIDWINDNAHFKSFRVGLSDTLNKHSYMMDGMNIQEAHAHALKVGDTWLSENSEALSRLQVDTEIIRWDNWQQSRPEAIEENTQRLLKAYDKTPLFRDAINADINAFYARKGIKGAFSGAQHSLNYLIEELAVYEEIFRDYPCITLYPGKQLKCFEVIRSGIIANISETIPRTNFMRLNIREDAMPTHKLVA